jgi:hypothetical protein
MEDLARRRRQRGGIDVSDLLDQTMEALKATTERPFDPAAQERHATLLAASNSHYNAASAFTTAAWLYRRNHDYSAAVRMTLHAATLYSKAGHGELAQAVMLNASRMAQKYGVTSHA